MPLPPQIYEVAILKYTTTGAAEVERTCCFNGTNKVFTWKFPATINAVGRFNVVVRDVTEKHLPAQVQAEQQQDEADRLAAIAAANVVKPAIATASLNVVKPAMATASLSVIKPDSASPNVVIASPNVVIQEPQWQPAAVFGAVKKGTTPLGKPFSMGSLSQAIPTN
jgi:hypothetical protein